MDPTLLRNKNALDEKFGNILKYLSARQRIDDRFRLKRSGASALLSAIGSRLDKIGILFESGGTDFFHSFNSFFNELFRRGRRMFGVDYFECFLYLNKSFKYSKPLR